VKDIRSLYESL
jgi:hypothetical protein